MKQKVDEFCKQSKGQLKAWGSFRSQWAATLFFLKGRISNWWVVNLFSILYKGVVSKDFTSSLFWDMNSWVCLNNACLVWWDLLWFISFQKQACFLGPLLALTSSKSLVTLPKPLLSRQKQFLGGLLTTTRFDPPNTSQGLSTYGCLQVDRRSGGLYCEGHRKLAAVPGFFRL